MFFKLVTSLHSQQQYLKDAFQPTMYEISSLYIFLPSLSIFSHFNFSCFCGCVLACLHSFNLFSLIINIKYLFMCLFSDFWVFSFEMSLYLLSNDFLIAFLIMNCKSSLSISSNYQSFTRYIYCKYFLPIWGLHFIMLFSFSFRDKFPLCCPGWKALAVHRHDHHAVQPRMPGLK